MIKGIQQLKSDKSVLDNLYQTITSIISSNNLKETDEDVLVDLIIKIKELGLKLQDLVLALQELETAIKDLI